MLFNLMDRSPRLVSLGKGSHFLWDMFHTIQGSDWDSHAVDETAISDRARKVLYWAIRRQCGGARYLDKFPRNCLRVEYLQVATGDITDNVDQYRTTTRELSGAESVLVTQQRAGQAAAQATLSARQQALTQAAADQNQVNQLQQQLNQAIEAAAVAAAHQRVQAAAWEPLGPAVWQRLEAGVWQPPEPAVWRQARPAPWVAPGAGASVV